MHVATFGKLSIHFISWHRYRVDNADNDTSYVTYGSEEEVLERVKECAPAFSARAARHGKQPPRTKREEA